MLRADTIRAIVEAQEMALDNGLSQAQIEEQLRKVSLQFSIYAKIFARRMGKADEAAASYSSDLKTAIMVCAKNQGLVATRPAIMRPSTSSSSLANTRLSQRQLLSNRAA